MRLEALIKYMVKIHKKVVLICMIKITNMIRQPVHRCFDAGIEKSQPASRGWRPSVLSRTRNNGL